MKYIQLNTDTILFQFNANTDLAYHVKWCYLHNSNNWFWYVLKYHVNISWIKCENTHLEIHSLLLSPSCVSVIQKHRVMSNTYTKRQPQSIHTHKITPSQCPLYSQRFFGGASYKSPVWSSEFAKRHARTQRTWCE